MLGSEGQTNSGYHPNGYLSSMTDRKRKQDPTGYWDPNKRPRMGEPPSSNHRVPYSHMSTAPYEQSYEPGYEPVYEPQAPSELQSQRPPMPHELRGYDYEMYQKEMEQVEYVEMLKKQQEEKREKKKEKQRQRQRRYRQNLKIRMAQQKEQQEQEKKEKEEREVAAKLAAMPRPFIAQVQPPVPVHLRPKQQPESTEAEAKEATKESTSTKGTAKSNDTAATPVKTFSSPVETAPATTLTTENNKSDTFPVIHSEAAMAIPMTLSAMNLLSSKPKSAETTNAITPTTAKATIVTIPSLTRNPSNVAQPEFVPLANSATESPRPSSKMAPFPHGLPALSHLPHPHGVPLQPSTFPPAISPRHSPRKLPSPYPQQQGSPKQGSPRAHPSPPQFHHPPAILTVPDFPELPELHPADVDMESERLPSLKQLIGDLSLADPYGYSGQRPSLSSGLPYRPCLNFNKGSPGSTRSSSPRSVSLSSPNNSNPHSPSPNTSPRSSYPSLFASPSLIRGGENSAIPVRSPSPSPRPSQPPPTSRGLPPTHIQTRSHAQPDLLPRHQSQQPHRGEPHRGEPPPSLFSQHMNSAFFFSGDGRYDQGVGKTSSLPSLGPGFGQAPAGDSSSSEEM